MANIPANTTWVKARQTKFLAYTTVYVLIVVAVIGVINFLAQRYNKSFDSTTNKKFTLSDQTAKIARELKQDVTITYWDRPNQFQAARDLLDRYRNLSSRISVKYMDVDKNRTQAIAAGVKTFGTIQVDSGVKHQEAKSLSEEELTGAMVRALKSGERMVCFTLGSGEHSIDDDGRSGYAQAKGRLEGSNYKTQTLKMLEKPEIPKECLIIVVAGPTRDYLQPEIDAIKKFIEGGGRGLFMLDPPFKFAKQEVDDNAAFEKVIADWGVTLDKNLVLDTSGVGQIFGLGPEVPVVTTYGEHAIVRPLKEVPSVLPIARSLRISNGAKSAAEKLFETSERSIATSNLKSAEIRPSASDAKGPFILGAAGTYSGEGSKGQFVVVGSSTWASNSFLNVNGNRDLFMNIMNWLSSDEDLISIRPKEPEDRRITLTRTQMAMVFYSSVLGIPLLILATGLSVWWKRR